MKTKNIIFVLFLFTIFLIVACERETVGKRLPVTAGGGSGGGTGTSGGGPVAVGGTGTSTTISEFKTFPINNEDKSMTGHNFCIKKGYKKCVSELTWVILSYYESVDSSCNKLQYRDTQSELDSCDRILGSSEVKCRQSNSSNEGLAEPEKGDYKWSTHAKEVICTR